MSSGIFRLNLSDVQKGLVMAVLAGFALPIAAAFQTPGFDLFNANWGEILNLAINGAVIGFVTYMTKNFFSNSQGEVVTPLGNIG
jgi:hypothetical protein